MNDTAAVERTPLRAWSVLGVLMVFYLLSFLDKQMYALLINPIGAHLKLSDFQLGLVQGVAFSGFYTAGVLLAGWAVDRYPRRAILFLGVLFWSFTAAGSGLAGSFDQLFVARAGVGLGEAFLLPTALALLASTFPRDKLSFATGVFMAGANLGGVIALLVGGSVIAKLVAMGPTVWPLVGRLEAWQAAFMATGLPGAAIALLAFTLPRDPQRLARGAGADRPPATPLVGFILGHKAFTVGVMLGGGLLTTVAYALIIWSPAYFERQFHWGHAKVGVVMAAAIAAGGLGNVLWGWVADRMRRNGRRDALYRLYIGLTLAGLPIAAVTFTTHDPTIATLGYPLVWLVLNAFGPMVSAVQFGIADELRGRMVGLQTMVGGLMGLSAGPLLVSAITQFVLHDKARIGEAMVIALVAAGLAAVLVLALTRRAYAAAVSERERALAVQAPPHSRSHAAGAGAAHAQAYPAA